MPDTGSVPTIPVEPEAPSAAPLLFSFSAGAAIGFGASKAIFVHHPKLWLIILITLILLAIIFGVTTLTQKKKRSGNSQNPQKDPKKDSSGSEKP